MAELKNEGLPYWVYTKHPEIVPPGWDGSPVTSRTVDYLAPGFLRGRRNWYRAVMAVLAPRLQPRGGNVIAVQLDNEIGMLSWVTNSARPDRCAARRFCRLAPAQLRRRQPGRALPARPATALYPQQRPFARPRRTYAAALLHDLGRYMRDRFARYVATLRGYAEEVGVSDVPFVVNIHGTGRRARPHVSDRHQPAVRELYPGAGYLSGSDIYLGDLTRRISRTCIC